MACTPKARAIACGVLGLIFVVVGLSVGLVIRSKVNSGLKDQAQFCGEGSSFDDWKTNTDSDDPPKYKMYYGFNVTNVEQYLSSPTPVDLELNMVGPYAMRQYDTYFNTKFFDDDRQISFKTWTRYQFEKHNSCDGCDSYDRFVNLNPALLTALSSIGSELFLGLTLSNVDPIYGSVPSCTPENIQHSLSAPCTPAPNTTCCCNVTNNVNDPMSCINRAANLYEQFAGFDGGVEFTSPVFQAKKNSFVLINKNVHEAAYGYPSATAGLAQGLQNMHNRDVLEPMANFTELAFQVCNYSSEGVAPPTEDLPNTPYQHLAYITCSPLAGARYWSVEIQQGVKLCQAFEAKIPGACTCVNSDHGEGGVTTLARPCCTLAGFGCLQKVTGYVSDEQYLTEKQSDDDYLVDGTTQNTGCGHYNEDQSFWWTEYESKKTHDVWAPPAASNATYHPSPSQMDVARVAKNNTYFTYSPAVLGSDGTRMKGTGRTSHAGSFQVSDGSSSFDEFNIYITQVYRPAKAFKTGTEKFEGIKVARFSPSNSLLHQNANVDDAGTSSTTPNYMVGAGVPRSGVQDTTYIYGFPSYVSQPLFLYGDDSLLTDGISVKVMGKEAKVTPELYDTFLLVEPSTGMTFEGHKRLQASFALYTCDSPLQGCDPSMKGSLANLMNPFLPGGHIIPQYYMDETAKATDDQVSDFKAVMRANQAGDIILILFPLVGGVFLAVAFYQLWTAMNDMRRGSSVVGVSLMQDQD